MVYIRKTKYEMEIDSEERALLENLRAEFVDEYTIIVSNMDKGTSYEIGIDIVNDNEVLVCCSCPHSYYRKVICKHLITASRQLNIPIHFYY